MDGRKLTFGTSSRCERVKAVLIENILLYIYLFMVNLSFSKVYFENFVSI